MTDENVCMMDDWFMDYVPAHWLPAVTTIPTITTTIPTTILTPNAPTKTLHTYGPFVFGAPQNWTTDDAVEPDGEYPPDPPKCADCRGKGKVTLFTGVVDCETCDGSGY